MAYTPGPWRTYRDKNQRVSQIMSDYGRICTIHPSDTNGEDNARLIAAAPELLEALEATIEWIGSAWPNVESLDWEDWRQTISKIITKARGDSNA